MIKKISRKYWIASISAILTATGIALACAGDWGEEYGTSNFTPQLIVADSSYSPFFYSNMFYYEIGHDDNHDRRFNESNKKEWSAWLGSEMPITQIDYLLHKATTASIDSAAALPRYRSSAKLTAFCKYLKLAKTAETFALNNIEGPWEYEDKKSTRKHINAQAFDIELSKQMNGSDPFLRSRYWFQRVRNLYFNAAPNYAPALFDLDEKKYPRDNSYYRAMAYAAGALYKQKNYAKANYYYSKVYDASPMLRTVAHYSFHPQQQSDWQATLALCTGNAEKATLWQMLGIFYGDEGRSLEEIYKLDPKSDKMDLLLVRAVNIYEQKFGGAGNNISTGNPDLYAAVTRSDTASKATSTLINRIAREGRTARPWVWNMAAGYLATLDNKFVEAKTWFDKTTPILPKDQNTQAQLRLLKLINTLASTKRLDARTEDQLRPELDWLTGINGNKIVAIRTSDAFDWMKKRIAAIYTSQGDYVKSECFVSTNKFYADNNRVLALQAFLGRKNKTPYESYCAGICHIRPADILEYQAIQYAYAGNIDAAISKLGTDTSTGAAGGFTILPGNPFNGRIMDCHDCDFAAQQKIKYSKLTFLQKLKEMKDKIAAGDNVYTNSMLLGNAYYNMSHFGNARTFYECAVIGTGHSDPAYIDSAFRKMLVSMTISNNYYNQALRSATTDEQRAKCQYMLAKCERNEYYNIIAGKEGTQPDFLAWRGFTALRQYSNTQFYKDVLKECGYFRTVLKK